MFEINEETVSCSNGKRVFSTKLSLVSHTNLFAAFLSVFCTGPDLQVKSTIIQDYEVEYNCGND